MNCPRLVQSFNHTLNRMSFNASNQLQNFNLYQARTLAKKAAKARAKAASKSAKAPKSKRVCHYVFPYPKNCDMMSLLPTPQCKTGDGPCDPGSMKLLLGSLVLLGLLGYVSYNLMVNMLWYNFDEEEDDDDK